MSRKILSWVLVPLTTFALVLVGGLSPVSAADDSSQDSFVIPMSTEFNYVVNEASAASTPSPDEEPQAIDACGTPSDPNYDLTLIPSPSNYDYGINGNYAPAGPHPTNGASSVTVQMMEKSTGEMLPDRVLNFPNTAACGPEAPNTLKIVIGACNTYDRAPVEALPFNVADETRKFVDEFRVEAEMVVGGGTGQYPIYKVLDGAEGRVSLSPHLHGLRPATYDFKLYAYGNWSTPVYVVRDVVQECGNDHFPPGDPAAEDGSGGSGGTSKAIPTGKLKQLRGTNIVCGKAINKKVKPKSVFKLVGKQIIRGKVVPLNRRIVVKGGEVEKIKCFKAPIASVVKLLVKKLNMATGKFKFKTVKKLRVQRPLSR